MHECDLTPALPEHAGLCRVKTHYKKLQLVFPSVPVSPLITASFPIFINLTSLYVLEGNHKRPFNLSLSSPLLFTGLLADRIAKFCHSQPQWHVQCSTLERPFKRVRPGSGRKGGRDEGTDERWIREG